MADFFVTTHTRVNVRVQMRMYAHTRAGCPAEKYVIMPDTFYMAYYVVRGVIIARTLKFEILMNRFPQTIDFNR